MQYRRIGLNSKWVLVYSGWCWDWESFIFSFPCLNQNLITAPAQVLLFLPPGESMHAMFNNVSKAILFKMPNHGLSCRCHILHMIYNIHYVFVLQMLLELVCLPNPLSDELTNHCASLNQCFWVILGGNLASFRRAAIRFSPLSLGKGWHSVMCQGWGWREKAGWLSGWCPEHAKGLRNPTNEDYQKYMKEKLNLP